MIPAIYRQGDVLFIAVTKIPEQCAAQASNIIVEGETTGHAHRLVDGDILLDQTTQVMYLAAKTMASVVHEEHHTVTLPPGLYQVRRQREYVAPDIDRMVLD